jgi:hypothetical protein
MVKELGSNLPIMRRFIGHESSVFADIITDDALDGCPAGAFDMEALGSAATLDKRQNGVLVTGTGLALGLTFYATDESFVRLHMGFETT